MDFFQAQESAKRSTTHLVILFSLAVCSLIVMTNLLIMLLFGFLAVDENQSLSSDLVMAQFDGQQFLFVGLIILAVIFAGSAFKTMKLSAGGKTIAQSLGGRLVDHSSKDIHERTLLNVVEEMAIASGTPVPSVYVLEHEFAINAFAAGFKHSDAVIGVTRGCIEKLDRDELQGVIAHEFSHILNGDMRLNMRLIGVLHGILLLGYIGYFILRSVRGSNKNTAPILGLGFGLIVIGFGGNFFGNIIKASVSRQREFLADASAVQFTRSKKGIASALSKIGDFGSVLDSPQAPQMSHAYFSTGVSSFVESMFATHPPLKTRINRIAPYFLSQQKIDRRNAEQGQQSPSNSAVEKDKSEAARDRKTEFAKNLTGAAIATQVIESIGQVNDQQLDHAAKLIKDIPKGVIDAVHNGVGARAFIYCLVLNDVPNVLNKQLLRLREHGDEDIIDQVLALRADVNQLQFRFRLPLIEMVIPTLKTLNEEYYQLFKSNLLFLIHADNKVDIFEWILQKLLLQNLDAQFSKANAKRQPHLPLASQKQPLELLLSCLIGHCYSPNDNISPLLEGLNTELAIGDLSINTQQKMMLEGLDKALNLLASVRPEDKAKVLRACLMVVTFDKIFSIQEMEMIRAISSVLECPMPPHLLA